MASHSKARIIAGIPPGPVTRFAPSVTGYLHLGHVANAVWTWGLAQARGGRVVLRLEDHDRGRWRPDFEAAILEDLAWLGLAPDRASLESIRGGPSPFRQSDSAAEYERALARLESDGLVYRCRCSRKTIARNQAETDMDEPRYPGTCRLLGLAPTPGLGVRVSLGNGEVELDDLRLGEMVQRPSDQCGDMLIRDAAGNWTYQLGVVVDDLRHGVDLIVRGEDILASTGRQVLLRRMLGGANRPVRYVHHPLIMDDEGRKLSKRDQSTGVRELRARGVPPEMVLGEAAFRTGLLREAGPIAGGDLASLFESLDDPTVR